MMMNCRRRTHVVVIVTIILLVTCMGLLVWSLPPPTSEYEKAVHAHHAEPPLGQTAIRHYDAVLANNGPETTEALYEKATILDHGILQGPEPVLPNRNLAIGFYRQIAVLGTPREQALAMDRLRELDDRLLFNPPPRRQHVFTQQRDRVAIDNVRFQQQQQQRQGQNEIPPPPPPPGPRSDSQNVHDSSVVKSVKTALDRLYPSQLSLETTLRQIRQSLAEDQDALKGLDLMERNTHPVSSLKMTEVEVLRKVWGRIQSETTPETKDDMVNMLKLRLNECGKDASCASGRVARVVDSLSTFDDSVNLRPMWALRQEMMAKASVLQQQTHADDTSLTEHLRTQFTKDYVDTGLMTANVLDAELESWNLT